MTQFLNEKLSEKIKKLENENKELKQRIEEINLYFLKKFQDIEININKINDSNNNTIQEIKEIKQIINTNNNNKEYPYNNQIPINYELNKEILNFFNKNEMNYTQNFSCVYSNAEKILYTIKKDSKINHKLKVYNNGIKFPEDTIIRCNNNDSEIYFNSVNINESIQKYPNYYEFPVEILFKDIDNIKKDDKCELEYYLLSDREGTILNINNKKKIGKLQIIII
jgi:hypothetical protein